MDEANFNLGFAAGTNMNYTPNALQQAQATRQYAQMMMTSNQSNNGYAPMGGGSGAPLHIETFLQGAGLGNNFHLNHSNSIKNRGGNNLSTTTTPLNH